MVRFAEGRFHGKEWPPSPARLFQAVIAGVGLSGPIPEAEQEVFRWWERLEPPEIVAPNVTAGQEVVHYVPRNARGDKDAKPQPHDPFPTVRYQKHMRPYLFDASDPLLYAWRIGHADHEWATRVCQLANRLYCLGHGVDIAWAHGEIVGQNSMQELFRIHSGVRYDPAQGSKGNEFLCPLTGSFDSLESRYIAQRSKISVEKAGRKVLQFVTQPTRPRFQAVPYNSPEETIVLEVRNEGKVFAWDTWDVARLLHPVQSAAAAKLKVSALPPQVRISPLPSIGHENADLRTRRLLVRIEPGCPVSREDIRWAFVGLNIDDDGREIQLAEATTYEMFSRYRAESEVWQSITPIVLTKRRRIEPTRKLEEAKGGQERAEELRVAAEAVLRALVEAKIGAPVNAIRVQQEPFLARGSRSEAFAPAGGFPKERLWHVEISFSLPVRGPLVLGEGQGQGMGVMAPARTRRLTGQSKNGRDGSTF